MRKYWVGQLGGSFFVYSPNGDIVAVQPDQESAEKARDALNAAAEEAAKVKKVLREGTMDKIREPEGMTAEQLLDEYRLLDISAAHYNPGRFLKLRAELLRRLQVEEKTEKTR